MALENPFDAELLVHDVHQVMAVVLQERRDLIDGRAVAGVFVVK